jgi:hypothetical protein
MKVPIKKYASLEEVLPIVVATVRFEAEHMGFVRLDDHVRDIAESLGRKFTESGPPLDHEHDIASDLRRALRDVNLRGVTAGPLMSRYYALRKLSYENDLIGVEDGMRIQTTRPLGMNTGPRVVPGTMKLFEARFAGMRGGDGVQMGIHFMDNVIARAIDVVTALRATHAARAVGTAPFDSDFEEAEALVATLAQLHDMVSRLFGQDRDAISDQNEVLPHISERALTAQLLHAMSVVVNALKAHIGDYTSSVANAQVPARAMPAGGGRGRGMASSLHSV